MRARNDVRNAADKACTGAPWVCGRREKFEVWIYTNIQIFKYMEGKPDIQITVYPLVMFV